MTSTELASKRVAGRQWLKPAGWILGHWIFPLAWKFDVSGKENVPKDGAFIVAANHMAGIDGPFVLGQSPRWFRFMGKASLFDMFGGFLGVLLLGLGLVRVEKGNGRGALAACLTALKKGEPVGLFPEGNRGRGDVAKVRAGVAWLAIYSGAPVIPVACLGTRSTGRGKSKMPGFRQRVVISFGEPVVFTRIPGQPSKAAVGDTIGAIQELLAHHVQTTSELSGIPLPADDVGQPKEEQP